MSAGGTPAHAAFVKAFNTNFAGPLLAGAVDGEPLDVSIAAARGAWSVEIQGSQRTAFQSAIKVVP